VHHAAVRADPEFRLLHHADLHPVHPDRHPVLGLLLAGRGRRPRQDITGAAHRAHHDDAEFRGQGVAAESLVC